MQGLIEIFSCEFIIILYQAAFFPKVTLNHRTPLFKNISNVILLKSLFLCSYYKIMNFSLNQKLYM